MRSGCRWHGARGGHGTGSLLAMEKQTNVMLVVAHTRIPAAASDFSRRLRQHWSRKTPFSPAALVTQNTIFAAPAARTTSFCAACGVQTTTSTRYVVFICPFFLALCNRTSWSGTLSWSKVEHLIFAPPAARKTTPSTRYVVFVCPFFLVFFVIAHLCQVLCHGRR